MTGNLQADGVQSPQTLFVRYCRSTFPVISPPCCGYRKKSVCRIPADHCAYKITHVVHGVVMLLFGSISVNGIVPAVLAELSPNIPTGFAEPQLVLQQQAADLLNAGVHIVVCRKHPKFPVAVNASNKACCGRVHHHSFDVISGGKLFQCGIVFLIGSPFALGSCVIIVFRCV